MLETLREYASSRLEAGERADLERRYAAHFAALAEGAEPHLRGPQQAAWLERLEAEQDNFRAVLSWSLENDPDAALRLAAALSAFWETRGHYAEGRDWLERALAQSAPPDSPQGDLDRARALCGAGWLAYYAGDFAPSLVQLKESLALFRRAGDRRGALQALAGLAAHAALGHDFEAMRGHVDEALSLIRGMETLEERAGALPMMSMMSLVVLQAEDVSTSRTLNAEVMALSRAVGDTLNLARGLLNQGTTANIQGDFRAARAYLDESVALFRVLNEPFYGGYALWNLGETSRAEGDFAAARARYREAMEICIASKVPIGVPYLLESYGQIAVAEGKMERAARLLGAADARRQESRAPAPPFIAPALERASNATREALGDAAFGRAWNQGATMSVEAAITDALAENDEEPAPNDPPPGGGASRDVPPGERS